MSARTFPEFTVIPHFKASEFACKCGTCRGGMMQLPLLLSLDRLRTSWGNPLTIVSGLRCKLHNRLEGGTSGSLHTFGLAVDLAGDGIHTVEFMEHAIRAGFRGIGQGHGILHLDVRPEFASWTYLAKGKRVPGNRLVTLASERVKSD